MRPETPRQRREKAALEEDLRSIPLTGNLLPSESGTFRLAPLDAEWVLERYPPILGCASSI